MEYQMIIDGEPVKSKTFFDVKDPATGELVGKCPIANKSDLDAAVNAARAAFPAWSALPDEERQGLCHAIGQVIEDNAEEIAHLLTREHGKPLNGIGSRFEMQGCTGWSHYTAELKLPVEVLQDNEQGRIEMHRKPIGVVGSILPWNWPLIIAIWHILPALRVGNTVVMKPSSYTSLSTLKMVEIINTVLPKGVLNIVTGKGGLGGWMSEHLGIDKISFTGSTPTGQKIMSAASQTLKRLTLELGGNDAGIVLPDADPAQIAEGLFWGAFINNGQTCAALKRLYVHESIYDDVCKELTNFTNNIPVGNGLDENNVIGPVQNQMQYDIVRRLVDDAVASGARVLTGANPEEGPGFFYPLTLLADVTDDMDVCREEQFGPVLPIMRYSDVEEALERANDSDVGLGGSVWSNDKAQAAALASRMECGSVWINSHGMIQPDVPFGGVKNSGIGVMFGIEGLKELTTVQSIYGL